MLGLFMFIVGLLAQAVDCKKNVNELCLKQVLPIESTLTKPMARTCGCQGGIFNIRHQEVSNVSGVSDCQIKCKDFKGCYQWIFVWKFNVGPVPGGPKCYHSLDPGKKDNAYNSKKLGEWISFSGVPLRPAKWRGMGPDTGPGICPQPITCFIHCEWYQGYDIDKNGNAVDNAALSGFPSSTVEECQKSCKKLRQCNYFAYVLPKSQLQELYPSLKAEHCYLKFAINKTERHYGPGLVMGPKCCAGPCASSFLKVAVPTSNLEGSNKCFLYEGYFNINFNNETLVTSPEQCQKQCRGSKNCNYWRLQKKGECEMKMACQKATITAGAKSHQSGKFGEWIDHANNIVGPRDCPGPKGCYRHGMWYDGNDIDKHGRSAAASVSGFKLDTAEECQEACKNLYGCANFIYTTKGIQTQSAGSHRQIKDGHCYLKSRNDADSVPHYGPGFVLGPKCCPINQCLFIPIMTLPDYPFVGPNKCFAYGGFFNLKYGAETQARSAEHCQRECKKTKGCFTWIFVERSSGGYGRCQKAKDPTIPVSHKEKNEWIKNAAYSAGPRDCPGPLGCYRYGLWYDGNDVDKYGKAVSSALLSGFPRDTAEECQQRCQQIEECIYFIYTIKDIQIQNRLKLLKDGHCYLKSKIDEDRTKLSYAPAFVMGPKCCPPPPACNSGQFQHIPYYPAEGPNKCFSYGGYPNLPGSPAGSPGSAKSCQDQCKSTTNCISFNYSPAGTCFLHKSIEKDADATTWIQEDGHIGGPKECSGPEGCYRHFVWHDGHDITPAGNAVNVPERSGFEVHTAEECQERCRLVKRCVYFIYVTKGVDIKRWYVLLKGGHCYLKSGVASTSRIRYGPGFVMGPKCCAGPCGTNPTATLMPEYPADGYNSCFAYRGFFNVEYFGSATRVSTPQECQKQCQKTSQCYFWLFDKRGTSGNYCRKATNREMPSYAYKSQSHLRGTWISMPSPARLHVAGPRECPGPKGCYRTGWMQLGNNIDRDGKSVAEEKNSGFILGSPEECQKWCQLVDNCVYFLYTTRGLKINLLHDYLRPGHCYLKSRIDTNSANVRSAPAFVMGPKCCPHPNPCNPTSPVVTNLRYPLEGSNKCFAYGGYFNLKLEDETIVASAEDCQKECQNIKDCYNWLFDRRGSYNACRKAKNPANIIGHHGQGVGRWISYAEHIAGPRDCPGPEGCFRHGVWYAGHDIDETGQALTSAQDFGFELNTAEACQDWCLNIKECVYFIYVTKGVMIQNVPGHKKRHDGRCYMKSRMDANPTTVYGPGYVMGPKCCPNLN